MKWFVNLSMHYKLFLGFGLTIVCITLVAATAYRGYASIQATQNSLYQKEFANVGDLLNLRIEQHGLRAALLSMTLMTENSNIETWHQEVKERSKKITEVIQRLLARNQDDLPMLTKLEAMGRVSKDFNQTRDEQLIPLILAGNTDQARALILGVQEERFRETRDIAKEMGDSSAEGAADAMAVAELAIKQMSSKFILIAAFAMLLAGITALLISRIIAIPLQMLASVAGIIASGDLSIEFPTSRRTDEVGNLMRALSSMQDGLHKLMRETHKGVAVLSSSSNEIRVIAVQVAAGAAQTASAVSQTTATVEQVKQTVQLSSQKARSVSDTAQKASQVSQNGRKSVEEAISGMKCIQEQIESIGESIMLLIEQSEAIGEIIASVNDLAEQSNLLAVNAAIEANKAGERGKGFVVIAQEVKTLAEQSKQATAQVRLILGNIQRATSTVVLITEQGAKGVLAGVKKTSETGEAIRELSDSMVEMARAAAQIAASSQQQMVGMDQVALAMENIKQASELNVMGSQKTEVAAQELHELGQRMQLLTAQYKI